MNNGARFETYLIAGERGSGVIGVNGAAARMAHQGDLVIIISYAQMSTKKARAYLPTVVHVDENNAIISRGCRPGRRPRRRPGAPALRRLTSLPAPQNGGESGLPDRVPETA